jgi:hypothetical protein
MCACVCVQLSICMGLTRPHSGLACPLTHSVSEARLGQDTAGGRAAIMARTACRHSTARCVCICIGRNTNVVHRLALLLSVVVAAPTRLAHCYVITFRTRTSTLRLRLRRRPAAARASLPASSPPSQPDCKHTTASAPQTTTHSAPTASPTPLALPLASPPAPSPSSPVLRCTQRFHNDRRSMAVPAGGVDKRRQPLPAGLLHHHVQRSGMVSSLLSDAASSTARAALRAVTPGCRPVSTTHSNFAPATTSTPLTSATASTPTSSPRPPFTVS